MKNSTLKLGSQYKTSRARAFTLVECLAVTSIIALLLSILLPVMAKVRQQAIKVVCQAQLRSWSAAFAAYTTDNKNHFPLGTVNFNVDIETAHQSVWIGALKKYYQNPEMRRCPATLRTDTSSTAKGVWEYAKNMARYLNPGDYGSYGINGWIETIVPGINDLARPNLAAANAWQRMDLAKNMDKIPVLLDAVEFFAFPVQGENPSPTLKSRASIVATSQMGRFGIPRHPSSAVNSLFMDSSVRSVKVKELCSLKWYKSYNTNFVR